MKLNYLLVFFVLTFVFSCKTKDSEENKVNDSQSTTNIENSGLPENVGNVNPNEVRTVFYNLPSPIELSNLLEKAGATYEPGLLNPINNKDKYTTNSAIALNLGVYGADLSYTRMLNQVQGTLNYLNVVRELSQKLGIPQTEEVFALDRLEANLENKDSLLRMINDLYIVADVYLKESERRHASTYVLMGAWIESLYLATNLVVPENPNEEILNRIAEQRYSLKILLDMSNTLDNDGYIEKYKTQLVKIQEIFTSMKTKQKEGEIITDEKQRHTSINNEIIIEITPEQVFSIKEMVAELRKQIIS